MRWMYLIQVSPEGGVNVRLLTWSSWDLIRPGSCRDSSSVQRLPVNTRQRLLMLLIPAALDSDSD